MRRTGGARAGGFPGADKVLAQIDNPASLARKRVGLIAQERIPVREQVEIRSLDGQVVGVTTSGLLAPTFDQPIAMAYVAPALAAIGTQLHAMVRGKPVPVEVAAMPLFLPAISAAKVAAGWCLRTLLNTIHAYKTGVFL